MRTYDLYSLTYLPGYGPAVIRFPGRGDNDNAYNHNPTIGFGAELRPANDNGGNYSRTTLGFVAERLN